VATPATSFPLTNKKIADSIVEYARRAQEYSRSQFSIRSTLEYIDREYQREGDMTDEQWKARMATKAGDKRRRTNLTVPIVMPQVESALAYFSEVFLTGYPIFGVGSSPEFDDAALQMETIIAENSLTAGWSRQLSMFFRDGFKYNLQGIEVLWDRKTTAAIETDVTLPDGKSGKPKEVIWEGNCLKRMDLYNTIFDPRCPPAEIHSQGDFAGYVELCSRTNLKRYINDLFGKIPTAVAMRAFESGGADLITPVGDATLGYYVPLINPDAMIDREGLNAFDWMAWATDQAKQKIQYKNVYEKLTLYARIIPQDFDLYVPQDNTPQVWKFIIINNKVLLYAERCTNAHGLIPIIFGQPLEDGLGYQTKSLALNVVPFQDLASAAMNANIASKRRLVMDRTLYDPSRIRDADINSDNPSAKIPVRPSAYGKPVGDSVYAFPYRDDLSAQVTQEAELYVRYANLTTGQNPAQQGQFVKGNKTRSEYQDVMGHSNSRNKMMAINGEHQVLMPIKEIIKINMLQYQTTTVMYNRDLQQTVKIDPLTLRKAVAEFKLSDGILPGDKLFNSEEFEVAVQVLGSSSAVAAGYRMSDVFTHLFKQRGVDLRPFQKTPSEIQYEQQLMAWQQQATLAAEKNTPFNTPMPQPPAPELIEQQIAQMRARRGQSLKQLIEAAEKVTRETSGAGAAI
jgi:hypothetical protein